MPPSQPTDLLKGLGLSRNPFTDRTAEKTLLDASSLYTHSDLQGFQPSGAQQGAAVGSLECMYEPTPVSFKMVRLIMHFKLVLCRPDVSAVWAAGFRQDHHPHAGKDACSIERLLQSAPRWRVRI